MLFNVCCINNFILRSRIFYYYYVQTPKVFYKLEGMKRRGCGRTYSEIVSQVQAERRVMRIERTFMAPEYG